MKKVGLALLLGIAACETIPTEQRPQSQTRSFQIEDTEDGVILALFNVGELEPSRRIALQDCDAGANNVCWSAEDIRIIFPKECANSPDTSYFSQYGYLISPDAHSSYAWVMPMDFPLRLAYGYWDQAGITSIAIADEPSTAPRFLELPLSERYYSRSGDGDRYSCSPTKRN